MFSSRRIKRYLKDFNWKKYGIILLQGVFVTGGFIGYAYLFLLAALGSVSWFWAVPVLTLLPPVLILGVVLWPASFYM